MLGLLLTPLGWVFTLLYWVCKLSWFVLGPLFGLLGVLLGFVSFLPYAGFEAVCGGFYTTQNLKKKYGAEWALVTGSSSGIGKAIATKLADQGLNVVLVAYPNALLDDTVKGLEEAFPERQFKKVPADLGNPGYMEVVEAAIDGLKIQCFFLNAGYIQTGFFANTKLERLMTNFECNITSPIQLTHMFLKKLQKAELPGCLVYTSSPAALLPTPFSVLYSATKTGLSSFAASLAAEVKHCGIDVLCFHPSPVASNFLAKAHDIDALKFFDQFSVKPEQLPDTVFASIGRTVWRDVGPVAIMFRLISKIIDYNSLAKLTAHFAAVMPDFQKYKDVKDE